jgi:glucose/arabinose dehydrogenase
MPLVLLLFALAQADAVVEPWSDPALAVTSNLAGWYDARVQDGAARQQGLSATRSGQSVSAWFDGSGHRRHLLQRRGESQPVLLGDRSLAAIRFDGKDDALEAARLDLRSEALAVFLVAAPRENPGGFRGLLALNRTGRRDYESGLCIDLGPFPTGSFETLNLEGFDFGGFRDMLDLARPFAAFQLIEAVFEPGAGGVKLAIDGLPQRERDRADQAFVVDELTVGARYFNNSGGAQRLEGFLAADIAEVLIYEGRLLEQERARIRGYLQAKHKALLGAERPDRLFDEIASRRVSAHMLLPGLRVRTLPLRLPNLNNVRYREDGTLVALGYNGVVWLLDDTDGDGLEDRARVFFDEPGALRAPIGMALTAPGDPRGRGVYVASKGKCSLILDTDSDDRADRELIVAQGWPEIPHGVDALGVALGAAGSVYFGIGAADFTNAYLLDEDGKPRFDLDSERGTIVRVLPDGSKREIVATGIRFPVALAFHPAGDLFATDQEGATWLANGNPFDELLHIRPGRHYGFPPRHSRFLPDVVDEPSVFDYRPQHQSTCGLTFNRSTDGGAEFGPRGWRDDALVCGYSRGKLYRTQLVKHLGEYTAKTDLIAVFDRLVVDAAVSASGELVVACHSGAPDWGSGPQGEGDWSRSPTIQRPLRCRR